MLRQDVPSPNTLLLSSMGKTPNLINGRRADGSEHGHPKARRAYSAPVPSLARKLRPGFRTQPLLKLTIVASTSTLPSIQLRGDTNMAFRDWTKSENLETHGPLTQFQNTRIAIDAEDYLTTLLTNTQTREPLLPALGGLPFALQKHVDGDLKGFKDAGIEPVFVFNGLELACRGQNVVGRGGKRAAANLSEAWAIYDQGRGDDAVVAFGKACKFSHVLA